MNSKSYILPILLLYLLTSCIFLIFFSFTIYQNKKNLLIRESIDELKEFSFELAELNSNGNLFAYKTLNEDIKVNLYKDKQVIQEEFISPNFKQAFFIFDGKYLYLRASMSKNSRVYFWQNQLCFDENCKLAMNSHMKKMLNKNYDLVLRSQNLRAKIFKIISQIFFLSFGILSLILLIAYFIVKLSFKNMQNQLNQLNNFIIDTTHEINTPLCAILMSIEMFDNNPKKYLQNIKTASNTLSLIYDDLVKLNLLEEKNDLKELDIKKLIEQRATFFSSFLEKKKINVELFLDEVKIISDENKLTKIFDNLMSNAIKYSKENSLITVKLKNKELNIINYNSYIKKADLKKIFERFKRFDKQNGGFGIGLNIVKKYCDDLNIKITSQSDEKETCFTLKF